MKIQQISRFRLGEQGRDDGYQIAGISAQVDSSIESEFTGMYTTVRVSEELGNMLPYTLDCGYDVNGTHFYMTQIYSRKDAKGRPTPYCHGLILDNEQMNKYFTTPDKLFCFGEDNFQDKCNTFQSGKQELPEIEELALDSRVLTVEGIREKYNLSDAAYENLLRHIYEVVLSEGKLTLSFGWNQSMDTFAEVIKDMMFLAFSAMPLVLRKKITFSNYQIQGLSTRMFSVVPEKYCEGSKSAWFNLVNFNASALQEDIDGTRYKTQYISYLALGTDEERENLLKYMDEFLGKVFKHPEIKVIPIIGNAMVPAFYSYNDRIVDTYLKPTNAAKIINSILHLKVDKPEIIADIGGKLLGEAISIEAKINDVQFKNFQKFYFENDSEIYGKAFVAALATRDITTVKKLFMESLKEKSNPKTDSFIAELLSALSDTEDIMTNEVVEALADRYPITESEELQDFYLNYINSLYSEQMTQEEASKLVKKAIEFIKENRNLPSYDRAAMYMERQLEQLKQYNLILQDDVLQQLLQVCVEYSNDYGISDTILDYYMQVYMDMPVEQAIVYYEYLLKHNKEVVKQVNGLLKKKNSNIQDVYYTKLLFPKTEKKLKTVEDYQKQLDFVRSFAVSMESETIIIQHFIDSLKADMAKKVDEEEVDDKKGSKKEVEQTKGSLLANNIIFNRLVKAIDKVDEIDVLQKGTMKEELIETYWDMVNLGSISRKFYVSEFQQVDCEHKKCKKIKKYWDAYEQFADGVKHEYHYVPSMDVIQTLTTTECIKSLSLLTSRVRKVFEKGSIIDSEVSYDVLLMKYYDFENGKFTQLDFLKNLTSEQRDELYDSCVQAVHPSIEKEVSVFLRKQRKKKAQAKKIREKKTLFFLIGGISAIVVLIAVVVLIIVLMSGKGKSNNEDLEKPKDKIEIEQDKNDSKKDSDKDVDVETNDKEVQDKTEKSQTDDDTDSTSSGETQDGIQDKEQSSTDDTEQKKPGTAEKDGVSSGENSNFDDESQKKGNEQSNDETSEREP